MSALLPTCAVHATTLLAYATLARFRDGRRFIEVLEVRSACTRCGADVGGQPVAEPADVRALARSIDLLQTEGCTPPDISDRLAALFALAPEEIRTAFGIGHAKRLAAAWRAYGVGLPIPRYDCPNCARGERRRQMVMRCGHEGCNRCLKDGCVMCANARTAAIEVRSKPTQRPPTKDCAYWKHADEK